MVAHKRLELQSHLKSSVISNESKSVFREERYKTFTQIRDELTRREGAFDQLKRTVLDFPAQFHHLSSEQEDMKQLVQQLCMDGLNLLLRHDAGY